MISSPWMPLAQFKGQSMMPARSIDELVHLSAQKDSADVNASDLFVEKRMNDRVVADSALVRVTFTPGDVLAADNTNFATLIITKRSADGSAPLVIGSVDTTTTGTGNWIPEIPVAIPLSIASVLYDDILTFSITKSGTGVIVPVGRVDVLPAVTHYEIVAASVQSEIESRLGKRYTIPFAPPYTPALFRWFEAFVTVSLYDRRGWNPSAAEDARIVDRYTQAEKDIQEAADSDTGKFDLPLRADLPGQSGISKGGPFACADASPYAGFDRQARDGRFQDRNRGGFR